MLLIQIYTGGYLCGSITSIASGSTQWAFYCQGIFTDEIVVSKLSAFTVCEVVVYGEFPALFMSSITTFHNQSKSN